MCLCGLRLKKQTLISTYCPLLLLYAPPFWNDFYKAHHSEKRGVLWLASYSMHCDWPNTSSEVTYGQVWWPILRICALQLTHPKCTHTAVNTHTVNTWVGSHLCCGARGAVEGSVPCSRAPQSWYWGWRERCTFTPPTDNSCRPETRTRNLWITSPTL